MSHYEPVLIPASKWTQELTTAEAAESIIHCGVKCSQSYCFEFKFEEGVCTMSESWIFETSVQPYLEVFREIKGKKWQNY